MNSALKSLVGLAVAVLGIGCGGDDGSDDGGDGEAWTRSVIDASVGTRSIAIALDADGDPHVAYLDEVSQQVFYGSKLGDAWSTAAVPGTTCADEEVALVLDAADHPHLAYQCDNGVAPGGIRYAHHDGTSWQIETVESSVVGARNPSVSLALTSTGEPAIGYYGGDGTGLRYATRGGTGAWSAGSPDSTQYAGFHGTSLVFDASDQPVLAYYVYSTQQLRLARFDGSSWSYEIVDSGAGVGERSTLRLDADGHPHLAYVDTDNGNVKYAEKDTTWSTEVVGDGYITSLALAADGTPWLALGVSAGSWVEVGSRSGSGTWSLETVPQISADWTLALTVDGTGARHLVWDDGTTGDAMYATR